MREPEVLIEQDDQRDGVRPHMAARCAERIGGLQRMSALDPTATLPTAADMHVKTADMGPHDRQIFLDLGRDTRFGDAPTAVRTPVWKRNVNDLINGGGRLPMTMATVASTGATTGWPRIWFRRALRERRRLPLAGAPRGRELFLQPLVLTLQPLARLLRFLELPTQTIDFSIKVFERRGLWLGRLASVGHAPVMPESLLEYKRNPLTSYLRIN